MHKNDYNHYVNTDNSKLNRQKLSTLNSQTTSIAKSWPDMREQASNMLYQINRAKLFMANSAMAMPQDIFWVEDQLTPEIHCSNSVYRKTHSLLISAGQNS